jgi:hypothetical protein
MQSELVDVPEATRRLRMKPNTLIAAISHERWQRVPDHDGKVSDHLCWVRRTFEAWLQTHAYE